MIDHVYMFCVFIVVTTVMVNDTLTGDPLMTVPISIENDVITSLCYEVHGEADKFFNLISDTCVSVNSHYAKAAIDNENITLNIVDSIGVLAYDQGICVNIGVSLKNCQASVNGANVSRYNNNGIFVRSFNNRVRISVPNCAPTDLVMWVFCTSGRTEDPYTWKYYDFDFIRFVVMRGLNLDPTSHGLIGKPILIIPICMIIYPHGLIGKPLLIIPICMIIYPHGLIGKPLLIIHICMIIYPCVQVNSGMLMLRWKSILVCSMGKMKIPIMSLLLRLRPKKILLELRLL